MAAQKRGLGDSSSTHKPKKSRTDPKSQPQPTSTLLAEEVDFPRGGGTSLTPLEVKAIRAEAVKEADAELFAEASTEKMSKKRKRKSEAVPAASSGHKEGKDRIRIEHLNYKRINVGMKIFGQIAAILPLALIVSLPNQLYAHVPITNISTQFTEALERIEAQEFSAEEDESEDEDEENKPPKSYIPELTELFRVGQYVRGVVSAIHEPGTSDISGIGRSRDEVSRASKRVELTLVPDRVNTGVQKSGLKAGFTLTASVKSREDHGYILDLGVENVSGFLNPKNAEQPNLQRKLHVGSLLDVTITKLSSNGRTCTVSCDPATFASSHLSDISSVTSMLPGTLVQGLITAVNPTGLNVQVLGFFDGTVDQSHLVKATSEYKIGKKIKARILYNYSSSPPKFSLSLLDHIIKLEGRLTADEHEELKERTVQETYPVGTVLEAVKVKRLEGERGIIVEISPTLEGFVHISHLSDDHVPSLSSSGPWKIGSTHPARVTGYFAFDGVLQLSLKSSVVQQKYFQVADLEAGELVKGTIKKLTDTGLFVSLSGGLDGVVWPKHYADITLKHPSKRFKEGANIKCRVLSVDPDRKRIALTAKKTLVDSTLPIVSKPEDVTSGLLTHAVVFKVSEKHLLVEFYGNMKAVVPAKEISDTSKGRLVDAFPLGRVVKVRILSIDDGRIVASIKQAAPNFDAPGDINTVEIGHTVEGTLSEVHKDHILLTLQPSNVRALLSLKNLANHCGLAVSQLRTSLQVGENFDELVVVTRNPEKGIVIVANKPKSKPTVLAKGSNITIESVAVGQLVGGRVTRHTSHGALVKITSHIGGILHLTDILDNFDSTVSLPAVDSIIKATVVAIDVAKRQLILSTRQSRMSPLQSQEVADPEISSMSDLQIGQTIRGFVKNIINHGLFVTIGREIDARVQIKELFDEYVKDWQSRFKVQQVVKGRILSIDLSSKKVELSFRSGDLSQKRPATLSVGDLKAGQKVNGTVKKIEDYGLFVQIENSKFSGLCHKSQLSDNPDADVAIALRGFREGDRVKAAILKIENGRISLSLKPSNFSKEELEEDSGAEDEEDQINHDDAEGIELHEASGSESADDPDAGMRSPDESEDEMQVDVDNAQLEYQAPRVSTSKALGLTLSSVGGFQWPGISKPEDEEESFSEDEDEAGQPSKKKRKRKEIEQDWTADMHSKAPESNADFERLLLGSPNSSYLWIQYMSFQLPLSEVDKAREIARRAIKTINFREEKERLNVWIALLNLENVYGTDETLEATFKEAAKANDSKTIYLRLASISEQSYKNEKAEEQYKRTCKKFGQSSKVWTLFGEFLLKRGELEEARKLLPRSLQSLEKRKHLKTIARFAQLEYKHGDAERGKTLFEGIVDSHPKRWDMWSIYMDMEATQGNIQGLRNLFARVLTHKMTSHKAKSFFKKWLELERRIGDEEGAEMVKQRAVEWTQRASNGS
ncbi:unnamed protein product [Cyclocybe aegerita]|uniref:S1 motif domain-containing protein n=1 Tax=Cyclocybe aegerita TaxID=1973307 RepID=A0A8S0WX79_CYCAE|nr:unnamed protein product [Cyclocybe aegerita]